MKYLLILNLVLTATLSITISILKNDIDVINSKVKKKRKTLKFTLDEFAIIPTKGSDNSAGFDLYSNMETTIKPNETVLIHTGLYTEIPKGYFGGIYARSGLATKEDLAPANKVGVIDCDYRGEILVPLHNHGTQIRKIETGQRIAQLIIQPYLRCGLEYVDNLSNTERGSGGFGSTGKK